MAKPSSESPLRIGFVASNDFEYVQRLTEGILQYQIDRGGCVIRDYRYDSKATEDPDWAKRPRPWESWKPHGLIVNISADAGLPAWIEASGVPVVNTSSVSTHFPSVHLSFDAIARVAIEHFVPLGYTHFAYLACDPIDRRREAFQRRLRKKNLPVQILNFGSNPAHWDDDAESRMADVPELEALLRQTPKPLAILTSNDNVGRAVCRAARNLGIDIPGQVGILSINNLSVARTCDPPLSAIHGPGEEVSYRAMEILVGMINGQPAAKRVEIPVTKVHARESTTVGRDRETDVARAVEIIRDRACEGLSVSEVVQEVHMSRSTLYREFVATRGCTPAEDIIRIRLERAKELLAKTKVPITRIAGLLGYQTAANFTHFFQNQVAMSPRDYRKQHGGS